MEKTIRRLTYSFFFLLFIIIAPLLTMYSSGYRYDWRTGNLEKNGAFYIKSYPREAEIYVDNNKEKNKTPTQVTSVKPGTYELKIMKDKYVSWQKNLTVYSGETTFVETPVLFLTNREKVLLGSGSAQAIINKQKDKYAFIDINNKLIITDIEQDKIFEITILDKKYNLIDWSNDNQKILLKNEQTYFSFDLNKNTLETIIVDKAQKMLWENNSETLLYLKNNQLYRHYNLKSKDELLDLDQTINDFAIKNDWLIIQYTFDKNNFLEQLNKNNLESKKLISNINLGKLDVLVVDEQNIIFSLGSKLYIKNNWQDLISIPFTIAKLHDERLLLTNGHEIILFNYKNNWRDLIDRSSSIISDILWHPNGSYFISEINDKTNITELDGRDQRNTINLLNNPRKKMYLFNKKGDKLFILTPEENFYLTIQ